MGYPMSYQRVISRSGLRDGDYDKAPTGFPFRVSYAGAAADRPMAQLAEAWEENVRLVNWVKLLAGDLRRLERDTVDERATCQTIAVRTGLNVEIVAAVLKEFMAW